VAVAVLYTLLLLGNKLLSAYCIASQAHVPGPVAQLLQAHNQSVSPKPAAEPLMWLLTVLFGGCNALQARLAGPVAQLLQAHGQSVDPNLLALAEAWQQAEAALAAQGKSVQELAGEAAALYDDAAAYSSTSNTGGSSSSSTSSTGQVGARASR
jgi:hypothetical protein